MKKVQAAEEAEKVCGQQGEVDSCGAGHLNDHGHEVVEGEHAEAIDGEEQDCGNITQLWRYT